jgi:hypothetical protein
MVKKFHAFHEIRRFTAMFKEPRPEILSCGFSVQSTSSRLMNLRCISIPSSYPRHVCHKWFFSSASYYSDFKVTLNIAREKYTLRQSHVRLSYRTNIRENYINYEAYHYTNTPYLIFHASCAWTFPSACYFTTLSALFSFQSEVST